MAVRPVDAEKYMGLLKEQYLHHEAMGNKQVAKAWQGAMQLLYDMPTLTPPNEPLTLAELREMDGEPVWIVDVGPHKWYGPGWAIVDRDNCLVRTVKNWNAVFFESYGERWLAYRRPPEVQS